VTKAAAGAPATCDLCDAWPERVRVLAPGFASFGGRRRFHGEVATVRCLEDNSKVREQVASPGRGRVLVVDGGGSLRCALMGDRVAGDALANGWAGFLINGCIRDVEAVRALGIGVYALAPMPRKSEKRNRGEVDVPVSFGGTTFRPGDWVYCDEDGVVVSDAALDLPVD